MDDQLANFFSGNLFPAPHLQVSFLLGSGFSGTDGMPLVGEINSELANLKQSDFAISG